MFSVPLTAGDIYIWKDKNGVENITSTPPPENAKVRHRESFHLDDKNSTSNRNDSSPNKNRSMELEELNKKADEALSCMRSARKSIDVHKEIMGLLQIERDLNTKYIDMKRDAIMNNLSPSESRERTKHVIDERNEVRIKIRLLREKLSEIEREKQIYNCERH